MPIHEQVIILESTSGEALQVLINTKIAQLEAAGSKVEEIIPQIMIVTSTLNNITEHYVAMIRYIV